MVLAYGMFAFFFFWMTFFEIAVYMMSVSDHRIVLALITVFTRINAAALIEFFAPQVQRLFEGGAYLDIVTDKFTFYIFLFNGTLSIC